MINSKYTLNNHGHKSLISSDVLYSYFMLINDIEPEKVLDIGMLLKRVGALSRDIEGLEVDEHVQLDGIDISSAFPDDDVKIYSTIYDHIYTMDEFISVISSLDNSDRELKYDLVVAYDLTDFFISDDYTRQGLIRNAAHYIQTSSSYLITDRAFFELINQYLLSYSYRPVMVGETELELLLF